MSDAIQDGLRAAGLRASAVSNVFDAVVEAEHAARGHDGSPARALTQILVCVDHFGQQDFRLFPLLRREWPGTLIVAFHSPGFDYKGRLADLLGADVVLGSAADVAEWAKSLVPSAGEPPTAPVEPPARPAPEPPPPPAAPTGLPPSAAYQYLVRAPKPLRAAADPAPPQPSAPESAPPPASVHQQPLARASSAGPAEVKAAAPGPRLTPSAEAVAALLKSLPHRFAPKPVQPPARDELVGGDVIGTIELTEDELRLLLGEEEGA
jgi:hypothetical protein